MSKQEQILESDEVIILENIVTREDIKGDLHLTLTSKRMLFVQKVVKGLIKKEEINKIIDTIELSNIKTYSDKLQVKQKNEYVDIQTIEKNITVKFLSKKDATKFVSLIVDAATGTTKVKRAMNKVKKVREDVDDTLGNGITSKALKTVGTIAVKKIPIPKGKKAKAVVKTLKNAATVLINSDKNDA